MGRHQDYDARGQPWDSLVCLKKLQFPVRKQTFNPRIQTGWFSAWHNHADGKGWWRWIRCHDDGTIYFGAAGFLSPPDRKPSKQIQNTKLLIFLDEWVCFYRLLCGMKLWWVMIRGCPHNDEMFYDDAAIYFGSANLLSGPHNPGPSQKLAFS